MTINQAKFHQYFPHAITPAILKYVYLTKYFQFQNKAVRISKQLKLAVTKLSIQNILFNFLGQ